MPSRHKESLIERAQDKLKDLAGLPPGRFPDGEPKPSTGADAPRGALTADDAQGLPPHDDLGTGVKPTE